MASHGTAFNHRIDNPGNDLIGRAAQLGSWLRDKAAIVENSKRLTDEVVDQLVASDLFRMTQPKRFGGLGLPPRSAWQAVFEIARGCPSSAWVVSLVSANVLMLGRFSEELQRDVFLNGKPAIVPMLTGGVGEGVCAEQADGGIMLSGRWRYASGIDSASWVGLLVNIPRGNGTEPFVGLVPKEQFAIDGASWNVLGMRGTGSKDITLSPVLVPEHRWMSWRVLQSGGKHPTCPNTEPIYEFPLNSVFAMSILAPTVGAASAVADEFLALVSKRTSAGTQQRQIEDKIAHIDVATGAATMAIVRDSLLSDADFILARTEAGRPLSIEERAAIRMRIAVGSRIALASAQRLFSAVGGSLLPAGSRMERLFRDLHAMSSHFLLQPEAIGEAYGRLLLGLELPANARV